MKENELIAKLESKEFIIKNAKRIYEDCEQCIQRIQLGSAPCLSAGDSDNIIIPKVLNYMCTATLSRTQDITLDCLIEDLEEIIAFIKEKRKTDERKVDEIIANSEK